MKLQLKDEKYFTLIFLLVFFVISPKSIKVITPGGTGHSPGKFPVNFHILINDDYVT